MLLVNYLGFDIKDKFSKELKEEETHQYIATAYMSKEEVDFLQKFMKLLDKKKIKKVNELIKIGEKDIAIKLSRVQRNNINDLEVAIINESDRDIPVFPLVFSYYNSKYKVQGKSCLDFTLIANANKAPFVKILRPKEILTSVYSLPAIFTNDTIGVFDFLGNPYFKFKRDKKIIESGSKRIRRINF